MIKFIWKYKYSLLSILCFLFIASIFQLRELRIFYETERIIEMSDEEEDLIEKSLDDKNLLLASIIYSDSISYQEIVSIKEVVNNIKHHPNIQSIRSIYNEQYMLASLIPIPIKLLDISSIDKYNSSVRRIKEYNSKFISSDFKKLLFVIKVRDLKSNEDKSIFLDLLEKELRNTQSSDIKITGQIKVN